MPVVVGIKRTQLTLVTVEFGSIRERFTTLGKLRRPADNKARGVKGSLVIPITEAEVGWHIAKFNPEVTANQMPYIL